MKIGICQKDLQPHGSLAETLPWISQRGMDGFQIWLHTMEKEGLKSAQVRRMAADAGLEISALGGGQSLVDPATPQRTVDRYKQLLEVSVELGPGIVTTEVGRTPEGVSEHDAWRTLVNCVSKVCDTASEIGGCLALECAPRTLLRGEETWRRLAGEVASDRLKVNFDPANICLAGDSVVEAVKAFSHKIVHTHVKDVTCTHSLAEGHAPGPGRHRDVAAGEGIVNYPEYLMALAAESYTGYLTIEMHAGGGDRRLDMLRSVANLRRMLSGIGCS